MVEEDHDMDRTHHHLHAVIFGKVQGVGFRHWVYVRATELRLTGWVRNRRDGTVELSGQGLQVDLDTLMKDLHSGPPLARVSHVEATWSTTARAEAVTFTVRRD